jgi:hypothetical protein
MINKNALLSAFIASIFAVPAAHASMDLIAIGSLTGSSAGSYADLSGLTGTLENGIAGNLLGGLGSGFAYAGGNTFLALPDRGPNATAYNPLVADTVSYIDRFQTVSMSLTANTLSTSVAIPGSGNSIVLPYTLTPTLTATTLLSSATPLTYGTGTAYGLPDGTPALNSINNTNYFTGRSDGFDPAQNSLNANNARLDPEGIRVSNDGKSVFVSDEYGPYVYQFDRATGQRINTFTLPSNLAVAVQGPTTASEGKTVNSLGRTGNKGMEGLAITPDGKMLVGAMQANLLQDKKGSTRIVTINIDITSANYGETHEYAYQLTTGSGVSEIVAINDHEFLVDERDGNGMADTPLQSDTASAAAVKQLFRIDLTGAQDVTGLSGDLSGKAVSKTLFADVVQMLTAAGIDPKLIPSKLEGVTFGQDLSDGRHTLYIANDNDFLSTIADPFGVANDPNRGTVANPNQFYVFAFSDADLTGYQAQSLAAVPEPETYALMLAGLGLVGFAARRKQSK